MVRLWHRVVREIVCPKYCFCAKQFGRYRPFSSEKCCFPMLKVWHAVGKGFPVCFVKMWQCLVDPFLRKTKDIVWMNHPGVIFWGNKLISNRYNGHKIVVTQTKKCPPFFRKKRANLWENYLYVPQNYPSCCKGAGGRSCTQKHEQIEQTVCPLSQNNRFCVHLSMISESFPERN